MSIGLGVSLRANALLASAAVPVLDPVSPNAAAIREVFVIVFLICLVILVVVVALISVSITRSRGNDMTLPKQDFGSEQLETIWAITPVLIVLGLGIVSAKLIFSIIALPSQEVTDGGSADLVVVGHQWWWEVRYPTSGAVTANEIHIPVGQRLRVRLDSADVIHSFWVPQLAPKMDMVPGHPNYLWLEADRSGVYEGACSEFCGDQHAWMRFIIVAQDESTYHGWLSRQAQPAHGPAGAVAQAGKNYFFAQTCTNCHAIGGTGAVADAAPNLTHLAGRSLLGAGVIPNTPDELARWLRNPQEIKPGCQMPNFNLSDDQVSQLVAYLEGMQ